MGKYDLQLEMTLGSFIKYSVVMVWVGTSLVLRLEKLFYGDAVYTDTSVSPYSIKPLNN